MHCGKSKKAWLRWCGHVMGRWEDLCGKGSYGDGNIGEDGRGRKGWATEGGMGCGKEEATHESKGK